MPELKHKNLGPTKAPKAPKYKTSATGEGEEAPIVVEEGVPEGLAAAAQRARAKKQGFDGLLYRMGVLPKPRPKAKKVLELE